MEHLKSIATRISRGNREAQMVTAVAADEWLTF
jgi:hypothetical protein